MPDRYQDSHSDCNEYRTMPMPVALQIRRLNFAYPVDRHSECFRLEVPSLEIPEGKITVLTGHNGSGKTTLLRVLNGLESGYCGEVLYQGRELSEGGVAALRRESILVHQKPYLFHGSVYKNAAYGVSIRHLPRQEVRARACNALEEVGLSHLLHRRARSLSGGEKQRLAIARALATSPRLLFLDEPTGNCDPESARQVEALIRLKVEQGMTVVMTTHDHALGYRLGDQVVPMHQGHPHPLMVNVIKGKIESRDDYFIAFRCGPVLINCPALQGAYNVAVIPMDDLILSQEAIATSAQNRLKGRVVAVESCEHDSETPESVRVVLDCGILLQALVSHRSVEEMRIVPGALFHLSFKASAVRLY